MDVTIHPPIAVAIDAEDFCFPSTFHKDSPWAQEPTQNSLYLDIEGILNSIPILPLLDTHFPKGTYIFKAKGFV